MATKTALYKELSELINIRLNGSSSPLAVRNAQHLEDFVETLKTRNGNQGKFETSKQKPTPGNIGRPVYDDKNALVDYVNEVTSIRIPWTASTSYNILDAMANYLIE